MTAANPKKTYQRARQGLQMASFDILQVMDNAELFPEFQGETWKSWKVFLAALFGLEMTPEQFDFYRECTGRSKAPTAPSNEGWAICGRRGGKSRILGFIGVFLAAFKDYTPYLAPGEVGTVRIMAGDTKQARSIFRFVGGMLHASPYLEQLIIRETADTFELSNNVCIEVGPASFRSVRGYTLVAALCDEIAIWHSDQSANPDTEVLTAIRPAMATIPNAMLLCASSPMSQTGELWKAFNSWYGKNDAPLVWRAATRVMNSTVPQAWVDEQIKQDPDRNNAEYLVQWRSDLEDFLGLDQIRACVRVGLYERAHEHRFRYYSFCDPSGAGKDSMTLGIAHKEGDFVKLDLLREYKAPFSPEFVVEEFAAILRRYRLSKVTGDDYGNEWVKERFRVCGIVYESSELVRNAIYQYLLPLINSGAVELLDNNPMVFQLNALKRTPSRSGGRDKIEHPRGAHDDVANAAAGAIVLAHTRPSTWREKTVFRLSDLPPSSSSNSGFGEPGVGWMAK